MKKNFKMIIWITEEIDNLNIKILIEEIIIKHKQKT